MASTFTFAETYSTSSGGDNQYISLGSANASSGSDTTTWPNANPVTIPPSSYAYSYERWIRGHWTGTFTSLTSFRFWLASGTVPSNTRLKALVKTPNPTTYVTAINTASTFAGASGNEGTSTNDIPAAQGSGLQPTYNSGSTGTPATTQCSDYIVMQWVVTSTATQGNSGTLTYRMGWNEV